MRQPRPFRRLTGMFLMVVVAAQDAVDPYLPNPVRAPDLDPIAGITLPVRPCQS